MADALVLLVLVDKNDCFLSGVTHVSHGPISRLVHRRGQLESMRGFFMVRSDQPRGEFLVK